MDKRRLITNLFSDITHEFRNSLLLIMEPTRHLLHQSNGEDADNLRTIEQNGQKLLEMVDELLLEMEVNAKPIFSGEGSITNSSTTATIIELTPPKITNKLDQQFYEKLTNYLEEKLQDEKLTVQQMAKDLFLSRSQLHRKVKSITGISPNEFIRNYRLDHSLDLLQKSNAKISQIAFQVGFSDERYFSKRFKAKFGKAPSKMRTGRFVRTKNNAGRISELKV